MSFYNRIKKAKTIVFFLGKKINRFPIMFERNLLFTYGFRLIKTNNYKLEEMLKIHYLLKHLSKGVGGYTLISVTKRKKSLSQMMDIFNLPYKNVVPLYAITNKTFFSAGRLENYTKNFLSKKQISNFCGISPVFTLTRAIHKFLYIKILNDIFTKIKI